MTTTIDHDQAARQQRDELIADHAARSQAVQDGIAAAEEARQQAHNSARRAAENQDSMGAQGHQREAAAQARRIQELETEAKALVLERERIVSGNHEGMAGLLLTARQQAAMRAQARHATAKQAFEALLTADLLNAAREHVAACFDVQQAPLAAASALAALAKQ